MNGVCGTNLRCSRNSLICLVNFVNRFLSNDYSLATTQIIMCMSSVVTGNTVIQSKAVTGAYKYFNIHYEGTYYIYSVATKY